MGGQSKHLAGRCTRILAVPLALAFVLLCLIPVAAQAERRIEIFDCGGARGSGESDVNGNVYVPCSYESGQWKAAIRIYDRQGVRKQTIVTPFYINDVAPSPDGEFLYVSRRDTHTFRRLNRQLDGTYLADATWKPADFDMWGTLYEPKGEFVATDDVGDIYLSSGTWTTSPNAVVKYSPDGTFVTQFGQWENSWATGIFYWVNGGVAVTDDGVSVFVTEVGNNRVQRFDRQEDGSYAYALKWGNDPDIDDDPRTGICGDAENIVRDGRFAAPYDIGIDRHNVVYVTNTTCTQVEAFTTDGTWQWTEQLPDPYKTFVHGIVVSADGDLYFPQIDRILRQSEDPPAQPIPEAYRGWVNIQMAAPGTPMKVWRWTAAGWEAAVLPDGSRVWTQPFAVGWQWVWSATTPDSWYAAKPAGLVLAFN